MRLLTVLATILLFSAAAPAQSTRPSDASLVRWERTVSSLGAAIASHDEQALTAMVGGDCRVARFFAGPDQDDSALFDAVNSTLVLGDHAYVFPTTTISADIARDVNASSDVSDFAKKSLDLNDKAGRSIAMQWLAQALNSTDGEYVGMIILWDSHSNLDDEHRLSFVLVKGKEDAQGFGLTRLVYGDPLQ